MDIHAQLSATLHHRLENIKVEDQHEASSRLSTERIVVLIGSGMLDQLQPWYVGVVVSCLC